MGKFRQILASALCLIVATPAFAHTSAPRANPDTLRKKLPIAEPKTQLGSPLVDPVSKAGQQARGLYVTGPFVRKFGVRGVIDLVRSSHLNAAVIDLKDDRGRVVFDTQIPLLQPQKHVMLGDARAMVRALKAAGIYTIGRIVCFNDNQLARRDPTRAVMDNRPARKGKVWVSWGTGTTWLDPYNTRNHDVIVALAKEAAALGFDEVQLDYIRFPVDRGTPYADFPSHTKTPRRFVLLDLLRRVDEAIRVPLGVDVFGLTAFHVGDRAGLGQSLEDWAAHVEVFTPMLYVNNMKSWGRRGDEGERAGRLVMAGTQTLRQRVGPGPVIRPFLQAFRAGADYFNPQFIAEQVSGAQKGGSDGFLFWHPASNYGIVGRAMVGPGRSVGSFVSAERSAFRERQWKTASPRSVTARAAQGSGPASTARR